MKYTWEAERQIFVPRISELKYVNRSQQPSQKSESKPGSFASFTYEDGWGSYRVTLRPQRAAK